VDGAGTQPVSLSNHQQQPLSKHLDFSRFLILPGVQIPHLASHALALVARRLRADWRQRYGYAPVFLETFVTPPPHRGPATGRPIGSTSAKQPAWAENPGSKKVVR
jgi:hypothetical protein